MENFLVILLIIFANLLSLLGYIILFIGPFYSLFLIRKSNKIIPCYWWDYISPFAGIGTLILIQMIGFGKGGSMSNFVVEGGIINSIIILVSWSRFRNFFQHRNAKNIYSILLLAPVFLAILFRFTMTYLPE